MDVWAQVLGGVAVSGVLIAALTFLGRSIILHWLNKDVERYKDNLRAENDAKLESHKHALHVASLEHNVRFSHLHEKRANVIAEIYGRIAKCIRLADIFTQQIRVGEQDVPAEFNAFAESYNSLYAYFDENRIFLSPATCTLISELVEKVRLAVAMLNLYRTGEYGTHKKFEQWDKSRLDMEEHVPAARAALEADLRKIMEPQ
jgi:hypothetical protein